MTITRTTSVTPSLLPDPDDIKEALDDNGKLDDEKIVDFVRRLNGSIAIELNRRTIDQAARQHILLLSPSGNAFEVVVDDSGNLTANPLYTPATATPYSGFSAQMTAWLQSLPTSPQVTPGWWNNSGNPTYS